MFTTKQITTNSDGTLTVHVDVPEYDWLTGFILSFGDDVEILEPPSWREKIHKILTSMKNRYANMT